MLSGEGVWSGRTETKGKVRETSIYDFTSTGSRGYPWRASMGLGVHEFGGYALPHYDCTSGVCRRVEVW